MNTRNGMFISTFDLFKIGIGPSSSHTVGPMLAARRFVADVLQQRRLLAATARIEVTLYGSLALTGEGHGTDRAIALGLEGHYPDRIEPDSVPTEWQRIRQSHALSLLGQHPIPFYLERDLVLRRRDVLPYHTNGLRFTAFAQDGSEQIQRDYYSIGGGFILDAEAIPATHSAQHHHSAVPYPFSSAAELISQSQRHRRPIAALMLENEKQSLSAATIDEKLDCIWRTMQDCVLRGLHTDGVLPGRLKVARRAPDLYRRLTQASQPTGDPLTGLDWINTYALAVSEENAAGGRIVTAPTNGAAGIIPAVLHYYVQFTPEHSKNAIHDFLLTAAAIGILYKQNASISGAEVGCQGEIGVACSMAAAGLAAALGGRPEQIENAAEIGMEHNLGLTCDPVAGLVQIPCIERNAMGAVKAINAARIALQGNGQHSVSLVKVIQAMRATGLDMHDKYKETSQGGLAVSLVDC